MYDFRKSAYLTNYLIASLLSAVTLVLNAVCFTKYWFRTHGDGSLKTIFTSIVWHMAFAFVTLVHSIYMILIFTDICPRVDCLVFISGNLVYSVETSIGICNIFNAYDRLLAMWCPIRYHQSYHVLIQRLLTCSTLVVSSGFALIFYLTARGAPIVVYAFASYVNLNVLFSLHFFDCSTSLVNIIVSFLFLREFRKFLKQMKTGRVVQPLGIAKARNVR
ncbi:hypothetical protein QR680_010129 [Steinernema hermaphroditum]|uniref:Uncharacterized protein n=1 Tax=Steinernema hermaphroditum TaxID=289476 RepID=A0AA39IQB1_9BILA|nr:hypothetical protein QR680_010129 [Steinernema hermaphroditum]